MAERIISMRALLRQNLEQLGSKHKWQHITDQGGGRGGRGVEGAVARLSRGTVRGPLASIHTATAPSPNPSTPDPSYPHPHPQIGMFAYSGMTGEMVDALAAKHSIYMTRNGRISMAGVNTKNVARLAAAIHEVTK